MIALMTRRALLHRLHFLHAFAVNVLHLRACEVAESFAALHLIETTPFLLHGCCRCCIER